MKRFNSLCYTWLSRTDVAAVKARGILAGRFHVRGDREADSQQVIFQEEVLGLLIPA